MSNYELTESNEMVIKHGLTLPLVALYTTDNFSTEYHLKRLVAQLNCKS